MCNDKQSAKETEEHSGPREHCTAPALPTADGRMVLLQSPLLHFFLSPVELTISTCSQMYLHATQSSTSVAFRSAPADSADSSGDTSSASSATSTSGRIDSRALFIATRGEEGSAKGSHYTRRQCEDDDTRRRTKGTVVLDGFIADSMRLLCQQAL